MARRRIILIVAAIVVVALAAGGGGYLYWKGSEDTRLQRELAARVAASVSAGKIDKGDFQAASGVDPEAEFATVMRGMAGLKPVVTVTSVQPRSDAKFADVGLHYVWTPPGQEPWAYDVKVPLESTPNGWRATWSAGVVAPGLADDEKLVYNRLTGSRGAILGAGDVPMAYNQPAIRVGIDKARLDPGGFEAATKALVLTLATRGVAVDGEALTKKVLAAGPKAYVEAVILRAQDPKQAEAAAAVKSMPGVNAQQVTRALGISSSFLRPILGQVGEATADIVAGSGGQVVAGDFVGTGGLQLAQDATLRGTAGYAVQALKRQGNQTRDLKRVAAIDGASISTTIDVKLQTAADGILAGVGPASGLVAIRPSDGALLAISSGPGSAGVASTATQAMYPPGSTFKTVSGLAMLRHGLTPASILACPPSITINGYTFNNDDGYPAASTGNIPWTTAFAHSCNTAVLGQASTVTSADLIAAASALGIGGKPGLGVSASFASVPDAPGATEHAASMIGQGKVEASTLGMATVAASIAKGATVRPVLLTGSEASPSPAPENGITAAEAEALRTLMRGVAVEGTAARVLAGTPGGPIMAKTGTAAYMSGTEKRYRTWLLAIQGDLAVAVMVADGDYGASTCGPLMKAFLTAANSR
ncbi:MAG TPA: penicillin-binding transpeptidase domain-containing protein [Propioniciclava tarda]|nr:penicillin-binding transpeptidase domain-containing protein [Propioniciclava tarda]HQD61604.1 penicillin-binding transpeptidase domain-containing protein [Propioniciclava tarda]